MRKPGTAVPGKDRGGEPSRKGTIVQRFAIMKLTSAVLPSRNIPPSAYNLAMARGWESKSVEDQQAEAISPVDKSKPQLTPDQLARRREEDGLILTRKRILQQLETVQHPQHRKMLENALADVNSGLAKLG
jgi:hypothetical protein